MCTLTHRHLLCGDPLPVCVGCQEHLSVKHILIHCVEYIDIRHLYFNVNTVRELFDTVPPVLIISFIHRAGLLYYLPWRRRPGTGDIATPPVRPSVRLSVCLCLSVCLSIRLSVTFSFRKNALLYFLETLQVRAPSHGGVLYSF